jgi:hypothetical protein
MDGIVRTRATVSVKLYHRGFASPTCFFHTWQLAFVGLFTDANTAQPEEAVDSV